MASASTVETKTTLVERCEVEVVNTSTSPITITVTMLLDMSLGVLFREMEEHYFQDGIPKLELYLVDTSGLPITLLKETETPRSCWGARHGQHYLVMIKNLGPIDDGCEDDEYLYFKNT